MRIVFSRHGQTDWNVQRLIQGHQDVALNDEGRRQSEMLADAIRDFGIVHAYSSDLARATETARIVAAKLGIPCTADARLRECHFGILDGQPYAKGREMDVLLPHNHPDWADPLKADFTSLGGETGVALFARQHEALVDIHAKHADETILVVGHGRSLRVLMCGLGHSQPHFGNCEHFIVDYHPEGQ